MQYVPTSRSRAIICLALVTILHIAVIAGFRHRHHLPETSSAVISTLRLIAEHPPRKAERAVVKASHPAIVPPNTTSSLSSPAKAALPVEPEILAQEPHLDLDALRAEAVQNEIKRTKSPVELQNEAALKSQSLEAHIEHAAGQAQHSDCMTAHAEHGLLAPLFIAADLIRDKGCKF
jgi:hypothetical protein